MNSLSWRQIIATAGAVFVLMWIGGTALAHMAPASHHLPNGWKYPYACCSDKDCRPVNRPGDVVKITERREGYVISTTGEVIAYTDRRVKQSPDGEYHWCSVVGDDNSRTICLFVPPPAT